MSRAAPAGQRWGLTIPVLFHSLGEHAELVREAEDLGYTDLWSFETAGIDGFSPLAYAAGAGTPLRLGTAIVSSFTRGPATLAMSAAACAQAAPGRFVLGIGASTETIVSRWNGIPYEHPLSSVRETVRRMRQALAGQRMSLVDGLRGAFKLDAAPSLPVPIYLGALRPGMLRLAGAIADGVIVNFLPPRAVPTVLAEVRAGAEEAGRDAAGIDVVCRHMVCAEGLTESTRFAARFVLAAYVTSPPYESFLRWLGYGEAIDPVLAAWRSGDRTGALSAMSDELVSDLLVVGETDECRERLRDYVDAGVRVPLVTPFSGSGDAAEQRESVRRQARDLSPSAMAAARTH